MKEIIKLSYWKLVIASVVIGIVCHLVFNWSVWATALVINFIWFAEKYSRLLYIPAIAIVGWTVFTSYLPITASKSTWGNLKTDLFISKAVDSVQVKADLILEAEKNRQKNNLLGEYAVLLKKGKVEEAKAMMDSIDNLFYPKKDKEEPVAIQPLVKSEPTKSISMVKDSIFTKGTYYIDVKGETPFTVRVVSAQQCNKYLLASQTNNGYDIAFADGKLVHDAPGIETKSPYYETPRFKLKSKELVTIKMVVN
ncbi:MAG: hypothetical protein HY931_01955 [Candidatus Falkowbacteria bacterium]|nr:MAG: hypothetical protein HY931_01955 [Candidatus Falkowbacteria bacterium]